MAENTDDRPARLRMSGKYEITKLRAEIERLTAAKKAALKIADERGRENVELRAEVGRLTARRDSLAASCAKYAAEVVELQETLRRKGANRYWEGRWRDADAENAALIAALVEIKQMTPGHYAREHAIIDAALEQRVTSPIDRGNAIIKAQEAMRDADDRPSEEIILDQRDEWRS